MIAFLAALPAFIQALPLLLQILSRLMGVVSKLTEALKAQELEKWLEKVELATDQLTQAKTPTEKLNAAKTIGDLLSSLRPNPSSK